MTLLSFLAAVHLMPPLTKIHTHKHKTGKRWNYQATLWPTCATVSVTNMFSHTNTPQVHCSFPPIPSYLSWPGSSAQLTSQASDAPIHIHTDTLRMCWQGRDCRLLISRKLQCQGVTGVLYEIAGLVRPPIDSPPRILCCRFPSIKCPPAICRLECSRFPPCCVWIFS